MSGPGAHATFGGSGAGRLLACPGGYRLATMAAKEGVLRDPTSSYAAEGTVAHTILEKMLRGTLRADEVRRMAADGDMAVQDGHSVAVNEDMADGAELFTDMVAPYRGRAWTWHAERRVDLAPLWKPDPAPLPLFGTADFMAYNDHHLVVADYKFGKGVGVEVRGNAQLLFYALGAALTLHDPDPTMAVDIIVVQPRAPHPEGPVRRTSLLMFDLMIWAQSVLRPGVEAVLRDDAPLVTGDHCRWCPARRVCPALREEAQIEARRVFGTVPPDPVSLSPAELGEIMRRAPRIEAWLSAVRGHAEERMLAGDRIPGWKTVPKRSPRRWADQDDVTARLTQRGVAPDLYLDTKVHSPAQLAKRLDPDDWKAVEDLVDTTGPGGIAIAPDTDPRPALRLAPSLVFAPSNGET